MHTTKQLSRSKEEVLKPMGLRSSVFIVPNFLFLFFRASYGADSITQTQSLSDGKTLVSKGGSFELGFFRPGSSTNRYLGIWYKNIPDKTVVWVANRGSPINDSSGFLMINGTGSLLLLSQNKKVVWSTSPPRQSQNLLLQLLDSGNLVVRDERTDNPEDYVWQSFDYPSDTLLPGMKHGWDLRRGLNRRLTSWKNWEDPSPGDFTFEIQLHNYPDTYIWKGSQIFYRTGPWNGIRTSGSPSLKPNLIYQFTFVTNEDEVYFMYTLKNKSVITRVVINQSFERYTWVATEKIWNLYSTLPKDLCDSYALCGAYGNCIISDSPVCQCLKGFRPKSEEKWDSTDWTQGCVPKKPLSCQDKHKHGFLKFAGLKLPDTKNTWVDRTINLKECRIKCLDNCSCMAFTNVNITGGGTGCVIWFGDLLDIRQFETGGQDLYIRMDASELESADGPEKKIAAIVVASVAVVSGLLLGGCYIFRSRKNAEEAAEKSEKFGQGRDIQEEDMELPILNLSTIARATDDFSFDNKLGEGGFGPVYKGVLEDGQEIAVKRLSKISRQGQNEFKNEVLLIAKLQHRNLVRLLGCCAEEEEKLLVYEYMPNRSLDAFIFDFGMARIFGGDQTEGNTNRVVGTYGYMAPEYASDGYFSTKSDVFSFGILLLEIISGKKSRGVFHQDQSLNLIGYAWRLWKEGSPLGLMDACLKDSHCSSEVLRCIHISLLCVEQHPEDRPSMSTVVLMLGCENALPQPKQPGFFTGKHSHDQAPSSSKYAFDGLFSIKSDVFSFGILLLEIVSGKRNRGLSNQDRQNLVGYVWSLWKDDRPSEVMDTLIEDSHSFSEVLRCIHISFLCVQQRPEDRPNMSSVVLMLGSESSLPPPKEPGFFTEEELHQSPSFLFK
ncbi:hypothetical protein CJ030_MR4G004193 [Morella rubra]|uniref:Receptor-like serine/threonine-protein kinase n=1 Tax=Morella rubra TaxID=262757 RepID=A0A6A1VQS6_9ROSI|nr:hypothetical protein CJ030_MR4G004193 [Morella rubra]